MEDYRTIRGTATGEYEEKKSRFIAQLSFADSEEKAVAFLEQVRAANRTARHNVYAYRLREGNRERYSDDGEPAKTAGTPVLETIGHAGVSDVIVVVTRYFGGILLGSGGLIRAYSTGASIAVKAASKAKIVPCGEYQVTLDYPQLGSFQNLLSTVEGEQTDAQYTDRIALTVVVPQEQANVFESRVVETFNATVVPQLVGTSNRPVKV